VSRDNIYPNSIEGYLSIFKRGVKSAYQHCAKGHLQRYLAEFDLRNNHRVAIDGEDQERAEQILRGIIGKRLTYQTTHP